MAHRIADPLLAAVKHMPATATVRQMRDPLVQPLGRDQLPGLALMPRLAAGLAHRALVRLPRQPATLGPRRRRIRRRRLVAIPRVLAKATLELLDPLTQQHDLVKQRQHQLPRRLPARQPDRLYLVTPHARKIPCNTQEPCS